MLNIKNKKKEKMLSVAVALGIMGGAATMVNVYNISTAAASTSDGAFQIIQGAKYTYAISDRWGIRNLPQNCSTALASDILLGIKNGTLDTVNRTYGLNVQIVDLQGLRDSGVNNTSFVDGVGISEYVLENTSAYANLSDERKATLDSLMAQVIANNDLTYNGTSWVAGGKVGSSKMVANSVDIVGGEDVYNQVSLNGNYVVNGTTTTAGLNVTGNTVLGDSSSDKVTINGTTTFNTTVYMTGSSGLHMADSVRIGNNVTTTPEPNNPFQGAYSVGIGKNVTTVGNSDIAIGQEATASNNYSVAIGYAAPFLEQFWQVFLNLFYGRINPRSNNPVWSMVFYVA